MAKAKIRYFYDCVSPYAYLGLATILRYRAVWTDVEIVVEPMLLGGVMQASGTYPRIPHVPIATTTREQAPGNASRKGALPAARSAEKQQTGRRDYLPATCVPGPVCLCAARVDQHQGHRATRDPVSCCYLPVRGVLGQRWLHGHCRRQCRKAGLPALLALIRRRWAGCFQRKISRSTYPGPLAQT